LVRKELPAPQKLKNKSQKKNSGKREINREMRCTCGTYEDTRNSNKYIPIKNVMSRSYFGHAGIDQKTALVWSLE
jgi:hypothetical protein